MGKDVAGELERHRKEFGDRPDGLIFHGARGGILTRGRRSETWARYRDAIGGQKGEGWHQLRHYHASQLINAGMSVVVAERLGHRDATETLQTYVHLCRVMRRRWRVSRCRSDAIPGPSWDRLRSGRWVRDRGWTVKIDRVGHRWASSGIVA